MQGSSQDIPLQGGSDVQLGCGTAQIRNHGFMMVMVLVHGGRALGHGLFHCRVNKFVLMFQMALAKIQQAFQLLQAGVQISLRMGAILPTVSGVSVR